MIPQTESAFYIFFSGSLLYVKSNWDLTFQFSDFRTGTPATPRTPRPAFNRFWDEEILSLNSSCPIPTWRNPSLLTVQPNSANSNPSVCCWVFNCQVFLVIIIITEIHSFLSENHWSFLLACIFRWAYRFQFFMTLTCLGMIYHFQKDSGSFDA